MFDFEGKNYLERLEHILIRLKKKTEDSKIGLS